MAKTFPLKEIEQRFKKVMTYAPAMLGNDAVNFFKDRFKFQGWFDKAAEPWRPRKEVTRWGKTPRNKGRAILVDKGRLRRSIRLIKASNLMAVVGTDVPYARAHNEGFKGTVTQHVNSFERRVFTNAKVSSIKSKKTRTQRVLTGKTPVRAFKRTIQQNIPKRQFIGSSTQLTKLLQNRLKIELLKSLR